MLKIARIPVAVSIFVLTGTVSLQAAIPLRSQDWEFAKGEEKCILCPPKKPGGDFWDIFRRRRVPGGSRGSGNDLKVCAVTPGSLSQPESDATTTIKVWSDRPLFLWQDSWARIEIQDVRTGKVVWSQTLDPDQRSIVYDETATPLKRGRSYYWRLFPTEATLGTLPRITFRVMDSEERDRIAAELATLEGDTAEKIAEARAEYFAERELWSDALREIYAVENPSEELRERLQSFRETDFCDISGDEE